MGGWCGTQRVVKDVRVTKMGTQGRYVGVVERRGKNEYLRKTLSDSVGRGF